MIAEINWDGVFVTSALAAALGGFVVTLILRHLLRLCGFYRLVWHPGLFDFALFIVLWGAFSTRFLPNLDLWP